MSLRTCQALHRQAFQLAADADQVAAEASELATATERCLDDLEEQAAELQKSVLDQRPETTSMTRSLQNRHATLLSEVGALQGSSSEHETGSVQRSASVNSQRAALMERILQADLLRVAAEDEARAARLETMNWLAEMHRLQQARSRGSVNWTAELEAFVREQRAHADRLAASVENETTAKLAQSLASAAMSIQEADCTPEARRFMQTALSHVKALAESERRRRGLLMIM
mmetsp:Transcript_29063/g.67377  ORF Transcript_29063/g.67377 Transcript_29063/m.67377 type:complete len:230 (+) Transcript_29063:41-730(+)